jgi:CubicO group peptidase (beta-lactamase class C family)
MTNTIARAALALALATALPASARPVQPQAELASAQQAARVLFWNEAQKLDGFAHMERQFRFHTVRHGPTVHPLPLGKPIALTISVDGKAMPLDQFMAAEKFAGLLVIKDGRIRLEKYAFGYGPRGRWTSFSVAKSLTSTLVGAAIKDGAIRSLDDAVTDYLPGLKGSGYDGVTVRQLLTMTSGVAWNEDYADPKSDVARFFSQPEVPGVDPTVAYMRTLSREAAPGTKWLYKTGETNLVGALVTAATHKSLSEYLSEKIWRPWGMEQDAVWMTDSKGQEPGGCCISVSLRDYGRIGEYMRSGGNAALPNGWIADATRKHADIGEPGRGYGYQWWPEDSGAYNAIGIFGQMIHIDPKRRLVIVTSGAWPTAVSASKSQARQALIDAVVAALPG